MPIKENSPENNIAALSKPGVRFYSIPDSSANIMRFMGYMESCLTYIKEDEEEPTGLEVFLYRQIDGEDSQPVLIGKGNYCPMGAVPKKAPEDPFYFNFDIGMSKKPNIKRIDMALDRKPYYAFLDGGIAIILQKTPGDRMNSEKWYVIFTDKRSRAHSREVLDDIMSNH